MNKTCLYPFSLFLYSLMIYGCAGSETPLEEKGNVDLYMQLRSPGSTIEREQSLLTLRILVFNELEELEKSLFYSDPNDLVGEPLIIETKVKQGVKTFVLVGNEPAIITSSLIAATQMSEVRNIVLTDDPDDLTSYLPFVSSHQVNIQEQPTASLEMNLYRAVAKLDVSIQKGPDNPDEVKLIRMQVVDTPSKSALLPGMPLIASGILSDLTADFFNEQEVTINAGTEPLCTHYLYEHLTGMAEPVAGRATRLRVTLLINGEERSFDIAVSDVDVGNNTVYNVQRNRWYKMQLTVYPQLIQVTYNVLPWNEGGAYDKDLGGDDSSYTFEDWIEAGTYQPVLPVS